MFLSGSSPHRGIEHLPFNSYGNSHQSSAQPFDYLLLHSRFDTTVSVYSLRVANLRIQVYQPPTG